MAITKEEAIETLSEVKEGLSKLNKLFEERIFFNELVNGQELRRSHSPTSPS
jgi:hypothetical protein